MACAKLNDGAGMAAWEVMDQASELCGRKGGLRLVHSLSSTRARKGGFDFGRNKSVVFLNER